MLIKVPVKIKNQINNSNKKQTKKIKLKHPPKTKKKNPFLAMFVLFSIVSSFSSTHSPYKPIISLTILCSYSPFAPSFFKKEGLGVAANLLK